MSAPTPSALRLSADIELRTISDNTSTRRPSSPSVPHPGPSLPGTSKSSALTLALPDTPPNGTIDTGPSLSGSGLTDPLNPQFLHPVDTGVNAWMFLLGATIIEILIWGIPYSIGVLHLYWTSVLFPGYGAGTITLAATMQAGLSYVFTAIFGPIITAYPRATKIIQFAGVATSTTAIIASGFVTQPWHLVVTFGLLYPFAAATYLPCATILFEWFSARRGLAAGIMYAGTGVGGTIFPFLIQGLINKFGYKAAMVSMGIAYGVLLSVALIPIKRRIPLPRRRAAAGDDAIRRPRANVEFVKHRLVWIGCFITLFSSMGNFIPSLWLPAFADDLHVYPSGTGLISIMNAASVPGNALFGYLSDRYPIRPVIALNCLGTAMACFFLWGFGTNAGLLVSFVLTFGVLGLGFVSVWTRMISMIAKDDPTVPAMVFSMFAFCKGIGSICSGPIADQLLKVDVLKGAAGGYGVNNYGILLIFTGVAILVAGGLGLAYKEPKMSASGLGLRS